MSTIEGKKILVTRDFRQSKSFCQQIEALGAIPVVVPLIEIIHEVDAQEKEAFTACFSQIDWIVFTSTNGVEHFFQEFPAESFDFSGKKFAVVGKATEKCLRGYGLTADFVPTNFTGQCLVDEMDSYIDKSQSILFVKGKIAREVIPEYLARAGYSFQILTVYNTISNEAGEAKLIQMLKNGELDVLTFTSPSTVNSFVRCLAETNLLVACNELVVAVIGPTSRDAAEKLGLKVTVMPNIYTITGMLESICDYYQ